MSRSLRIALIAVTAAIVVALSAYAWRGSYTRYITDDFCTAAFLRERGFWGAMQRHREEWSGRFSFYAIKAALEAVGPATAPVVPGASVALFAGCAVWALRRTLAAPWPLALFGGCGFAFAAFDASPEVLAIGGPLVWETGVVTYTLPLILITAWLGLFWTDRAGWTRGTIGAVVLLTAGGLSETSLAAQCAFTVLSWLGALWLREIDATRIAALGVTATMASAVIVGSAPGNSVRMSELPRQTSLAEAVLQSPRFAYDYVGSHVLVDGAALLLILVGGGLCGWIVTRIRPRAAFVVAVAALGAYVASFIPAIWALSTGPPPRALHVSNYFLIVAIGALAAAGGVRLRESSPRALRVAVPLLMLLAVIPIRSAIVTAKTIPEGRRNAREMEAIVRALRAQPGRDVVVRSPWAIASRVLVEDPEHWTCRCLARYYGVRSVRVLR